MHFSRKWFECYIVSWVFTHSYLFCWESSVFRCRPWVTPIGIQLKNPSKQNKKWIKAGEMINTHKHWLIFQRTQLQFPAYNPSITPVPEDPVSIYPCIHPFLHRSTHASSIHLSMYLLSTYPPFIHPSTYPPIYPLTYHLLTYTCIYSSVYPPTNPPTHPSLIHLPICLLSIHLLSTHLYIHLFTNLHSYSLIYSSIHPPLHQ